ncbi:hypothetical protein GV819_26875 [Pseudomonas sp. Fl5BN2]|uniref:hypothetical protein n=1 Tax=Pseudomonas sp. Fl5BN2 TaxID=2697652 RepID=UPI00137743C7|nr:hypothetical protein [Pseudomonas sp. Fl5BN2]NBF05922.1 hypothetical protein [Pseudomonas sp. Fl5BN2]
MRPNPELRLCAVLLCGGLVYGVAKGLINGWNATQLFSGFLFGTVFALVLGIPLLLWGDRRCPGFRGRHVLSGLIQALVACLLLRMSSTQLLLLSVTAGLTLGALSSLMLHAVERLPLPRHGAARQGWWRVVAVPLAGGLTLGSIVAWILPKGSETLAAFLFGATVGGWVSMLVSWPLLWLVEFLLASRWRYVIGGAFSGLVLWLFSGAPGAPLNPQGLSAGLGFWVPLLTHGVMAFVLPGLVAGILLTGLRQLAPTRRRASPTVKP